MVPSNEHKPAWPSVIRLDTSGDTGKPELDEELEELDEELEDEDELGLVEPELDELEEDAVIFQMVQNSPSAMRKERQAPGFDDQMVNGHRSSKQLLLSVPESTQHHVRKVVALSGG